MNKLPPPIPNPAVIVVGRFPPPRDGQSLATERVAELLGERIRVARFNTEPPDRGYVAAETRLRPDRVAHAFRMRSHLKRVLGEFPAAPVLWTSISPTLLGHWRDVLSVAPALGRSRPVVAVSHRATLNERFEDPRTRVTMSRLASRMDAFVFLTDAISEGMSHWVPEQKRVVIPNTVSAELCFSNAEIAAKQLRASGRDRLEMLFLSNMLPEKGWMDVLRAAALAKRLGVRFRVRFAGRWVKADDERAYRSTVTDLAIGDVTEHLGGIDGLERIHSLLLEADALLLPSYHPTEGMPLVVLEAFSAGTPVIATDQGGLSLLVRDDVNGLRVPGRDPVALSNAMVRLQDPDHWQRWSTGARQTFERSYAPEVVAASWHRLLQSIRPASEDPV